MHGARRSSSPSPGSATAWAGRAGTQTRNPPPDWARDRQKRTGEGATEGHRELPVKRTLDVEPRNVNSDRST
jgi:hypothetical protein